MGLIGRPMSDIVPAVGDGPYDKGWVRPLNRALYPRRGQWDSPEPARGVPLFKGRQTIMADARADGQPVDDTIRPGTSVLIDPGSGQPYSVVWWDPLLLQAAADDARGLRRDDLISKSANAADVASDRASYYRWREQRCGGDCCRNHRFGRRNRGRQFGQCWLQCRAGRWHRAGRYRWTRRQLGRRCGLGRRGRRRDVVHLQPNHGDDSDSGMVPSRFRGRRGYRERSLATQSTRARLHHRVVQSGQ